MAENYKHQVKLATNLPGSATWARIEQDGRLVVEFYDFGEQARDCFGGDVAYLLIVAPENKSLILSKLEPAAPATSAQTDPDVRLLTLLQQRFDSYFRIQEWFQANGIPFEKVFDDMA
jgi:hypothetical protein